MRPGGGKAKGSSFEREVCVALSRWLSNGTREDLFWRSAMSGGRATVRGRRGKNTNSQLGDISSVAAEGHRLTDHYVIEAKFYADLDLEAFLFSRKGKLYGFWRVLNKIARRNGRAPLLIAKQNRMDALIISTPEGLEALGLFEFVWVAGCRASPVAHFVFLRALEQIECPL